MATNRNYCMTDGVTVTDAPTWLVHEGRVVINPSAEVYAAHGWLKNCIQSAPDVDGKVVASVRYEAHDGCVTAVYEYAPAPKTPRVYSKLYLVMALKKRGLFEQFMVVVRAAQLEAEWSAAQDIAEDFPGFADFLEQIGSALGLTDAQVEEILSEAVAR